MDRDILDWCRHALEVAGATPSVRARLPARLTETMVYCAEWEDAAAASSGALSVADDAEDTEALAAALRARQFALQWTRPRG